MIAASEESCDGRSDIVMKLGRGVDDRSSRSSNIGVTGLVEWRRAGLEVDELLRLNDFRGVSSSAQRLTEIRPDIPRGWLLRYLAMKQLEAPQAELLVLLQEGAASCEGQRGAHRLLNALHHESGSGRAAGPGDAAVLEHTFHLRHHVPVSGHDEVPVFVGEFDEEGVYLYQAYCDEIAEWALTHQQFGGPRFNQARMTWIKPSFGWVLYRSGYGHKPNQNRILKIKLSHDTLGELLSHCQCVDTNKATRSERSAEGGTGNGRVQWDPARDMMAADGRQPREMLRTRAIQIGLKGHLSEVYVENVISIQDVTELGHRVCHAHRSGKKEAMAELLQELPVERPYLPACPAQCLVALGLLPGQAAAAVAQIGRGKATTKKS